MAAWPLAARAQQPAMPVIGFFRSTSHDDSIRLIVAFQQGLRLGGYVEGQNVAIEYRWADNRVDQQHALAADLVARKVSVIVSNQGASAAVMAANTTIPFVFVIGGDPIKLGLVRSLSRPGGNVTGLTFLHDTLVAKQLELMRELVPRTGSMGLLVNPAGIGLETILKEAGEAARVLGVQLHVAGAGNERDLDAAFSTLAQKQVGALVVPGEAFLLSQRHQIAALSARHVIPTVYADRENTLAGGLLSYGPSQTEAYRQAGIYVSKILKGSKPAELPVEQSTKFELIVNLTTAKALGIELPLSLLMRVTEAIE
jgi:putative ABC transport system substrate-binding protein